MSVTRQLGSLICTLLLLGAFGSPSPSSARPALADSLSSPVALDRGWSHLPFTDSSAPTEGPPGYGYGITEGGPGLVIYSYDELRRGQGGLWGSSDGRSWTSLPEPPIQESDSPVVYAAGRLLLITSSSENCPGVGVDLWASGDDGRTWHRSPQTIGVITALTASADGVIAFATNCESHGSVWTSADGVSWRLLPEASSVFHLAHVMSVIHGGPGFIAAGSTRASETAIGEQATIWTSLDGATWTVIPEEKALFSARGGASTINRLVEGPQDLLAAGWSPTEQAIDWTSTDGVHWQRAPQPPPNAESWLFSRVSSWAGGFLGLQLEGSETVLWASSDGKTWRRQGSDEIFGGSASIWSVTSYRDGVVGVGAFALHPQPACLTSPNALSEPLRHFDPAVFLWSPKASQTAPPPTIDPTDPRILRLRPSDLPRGMRDSPVSGEYVNLCSQVPVLGDHRAYGQYVGDGVVGWASDVSVVAASPATAEAVFRRPRQLLFFVFDRLHRLRSRVRLGQETQLYRFRGQEDNEAGLSYFRAYAVMWRQGRVLAMVWSPNSNLVIQLARKQLAHLRHPSL